MIRPRTRLGRVLLRVALIGAVSLVLLRVAFALAVVPVLKSVARGQGLALELDDLESRWYDGRLQLDHLVLRALDAPEASEPLLAVDYLLLDLDVSATLLGSPRVHRIEVDGVRADLVRDRDGRWRLPRPAAGAEDEQSAAEPASQPEPDAPDPEAAPFPLRLPVEIGAVRVQQVRLRVRDLSLSEPLERELALELTAEDVGTIDRPTRLELLAVGPGWLDLLLMRLESRATDDGGVALDGAFQLSGLQPTRLAALLEGTGVEARARSITGTGALTARAAPVDAARPRGPLGLELAIEDASLEVDLERALGLDALRVDVPHWSAAELRGARVQVEGPSARARRESDGALSVLGLSFRSTPGVDDDAPAPAPEPTAAAGPGLSVENLSVSVTGGRLAFDDRAVPGGPLELALDLERLALDGLDWPIRTASPPTQLALALAVPGALDRLTVDGQLAPRPGGLSLSLALGASGVSAGASRAYLTAAGLESDLDGGRVDLTLEADVEREVTGARVRAVARGLALEDGSGRLIDLGTMTVDDLWLPNTGGMRLERLAIEEVRLGLAREADGTLALAGLRLPSDGPRTPFALTLVGSELSFTGIDLTDGSTAPARLVARGAVEGLVESLALDGSLDLVPSGLTSELRLSAEGIAPIGLEGLLTDLGLVSELERASLTGRLELLQGATVEDGDLALSLTDVRFEDRGVELLALDRLVLGPTRFAPLAVGPLELAGVRLAVDREPGGRVGLLGLRPMEPVVASPTARIDTTVDVEGFGDPDTEPETMPGEALTDVAPAAPEAAPPSSETAPAPIGEDPIESEPSAVATVDEARDPGGPLPIPDLRFAGADLRDMRVTLDDRTVEGGRLRSLAVEGRIGAFDLGDEGTPGALDLRLALDEDATLGLRGSLLGRPDETRLALELDGRVAEGAALVDLLPAGLTCTLVDGRLAGRLTLDVVAGAEGGRDLTLALDGVELSDGEGQRALVALAHAELTAPRLDPAAGRIAIDALRVEGLTAEVELGADGSTRAAGLALAPSAAAATPSSAPDAAPNPDRTGPPKPTSSAAAPREAAGVLPTVTLETLDVALERLRLVDRSQGEDAEPVDLKARLVNTSTWRLLDDDPESLPPLVTRLEASITPVLGSAVLVLTLEPFASPPHLAAELELAGLSGAGFERAFPTLARSLEAEALTDGRLSGTLDLTVDVRRRHPLDLDLRDGFGAELDVGAFELVDAERDERWLGIAGLHVEAERIRPATGDVHLSLVELEEPFARARVRDGALEFLSVRLPQGEVEVAGDPDAQIPTDGAPVTGPPADEDALATTPTEDTADPNPSGSAAQVPAVADAAAGTDEAEDEDTASQVAQGASDVAPRRQPEFRVDQLLVSGLDVQFNDLDADPPMVVPLRDLDLEVRGFTTRRSPTEAPLVFSALVGAGDVELPVPIKARGGLLGSLANAAVASLTGGESEPELEQRPLFRELGLSGRMTLAEAPVGWIRVHAVGLELLGLRGLGRASGVEIGSGVVDAQVRATLEGERGLSIESTTIFDDLSLSEPPGGPISKVLKLPAPLDSVLFLLRDQNGEIRLPVDVRIDEEGLSLGRLTRAVTTALGSVISTAVANSPLRVAGSLTGLVGLGSEDGRDDEPIESEAEYARGATQLASSGQAVMDAALEALEDDGELELVVEQHLGAEDLLHAERLANPSSDEARALARRLEGRREELERRRTQLAAEARTLRLVGGESESDASTADLLATESRLGLLERALDDLYGRLRPGNDRRAPRRTREAALRLSELRQEALLAYLTERGDPGLIERIDFRPARLPREQPDPHGHVRLSLLRRR